MKQLIECVPNISEGIDTKKINEIANVVETVKGVKLLNVDPGKATNRTVITFVGEPKEVVEAATFINFPGANRPRDNEQEEDDGEIKRRVN